MITDYRAFIGQINDIKTDITTSLDYIEWKNHLTRDSTVFIKPNFTFPYYKEGITTNPIVLRNLIELLHDKVARVIIGESNGGNNSFTADQAFKGHGMYEICKEYGADLVNLSNLPSEIIEETVLGRSVRIQLPKMLIHDIDCFISVPVLKVHVMTTVTLSIKNLWGCYPDTMRCLYHKDISRKLAVITKKLRPQIILIDGTYALDGHGPMYGSPLKTNLLISSNNAVVGDTLGTAVMGIPLSNVNHLLIAEKEGLGITDLSKVEINTDWRKYAMKFEVNKTLLDSLSWILFNSETCAKLVMDSAMTPTIYKIASIFRNAEEQNVVETLKREK